MILTATYVAIGTWAEVRRDRDPDALGGLIEIVFLGLFAWFDLRMAEIIAAGL